MLIEEGTFVQIHFKFIVIVDSVHTMFQIFDYQFNAMYIIKTNIWYEKVVINSEGINLQCKTHIIQIELMVRRKETSNF